MTPVFSCNTRALLVGPSAKCQKLNVLNKRHLPSREAPWIFSLYIFRRTLNRDEDTPMTTTRRHPRTGALPQVNFRFCVVFASPHGVLGRHGETSSFSSNLRHLATSWANMEILPLWPRVCVASRRPGQTWRYNATRQGRRLQSLA